MTDSISQKVSSLGHRLPARSAALANYLPFVRQGNTLYISGQIGLDDGRPVEAGRLGATLDVDQGYRAARAAALRLVGRLADVTDDRLSAVSRIVRLSVFVASTPEFANHPQVANGASDLLVDVFGEAGRHARTAVGVSSLPLGASVEVEAIVELAD